MSNAGANLSLAVVLLNYRRADLVVDCLASIAPERLDALNAAVVVVDNASGDGSAPRIVAAIRERGWSAWARLVESPRNGGFSAGNNVGIAAVRADHYLLLNSDTLVRPGAIATLLASMQAQPGVGLLGPRLEDRDGTPQESCFRVHTPASELMAAAATGPVSRLLSRYTIAQPASDAPLDTPWISFACVLIRGAALREVGPLDEDFFMYFEDVDYCRRAWKHGWRVRYEPAARVVHLRGGSSPVKQSFAERKRVPSYFYASRTRYFAKYYGGVPGVVVANLAWLIGRGISWLRETLGNKRPHTAERHALDLWTGWASPLAPPEDPRA